MTSIEENRFSDDNGDVEAAEAAAIEWHVKVMSGAMPRSEMATFETWLRSNPANAAAYARLVEIWDGMEPLGDTALVREGLKPLGDDGRRGYGEALSGGVSAFFQRFSGALPTAAAALCVLVAGVVGVQYQAMDEDLYRTAIGEQELIELSDGSTIMLNTASTVDVDYAEGERRITLLEGQASFKVAKDADRPFIVYAGEGSVRALGTEFDVYKSSEGVRVTLIEGRVRVASIEAPSSMLEAAAVGGASPMLTQIELSPGEQAAIAPVGIVPVEEPVDVERVTAWREGKVSFRNTPLAEAVAEMNRYSVAPITLGDGALADLRVSGVFRVSNSDHFVNALESLFDITAHRSAAGVVLEEPA